MIFFVLLLQTGGTTEPAGGSVLADTSTSSGLATADLAIIGVVLFIAVIALVTIFLHRRRSRHQQRQNTVVAWDTNANLVGVSVVLVI